MIPAALRRAMRLASTNRLRFGHGTRARIIGGIASIVSFDTDPADFSHPWQASLVNTSSAIFRLGSVNRVAAGIKGVPLDGGDTGEPPQLTWTKLKLDDEGRGYFCAEVTVDPTKFFEVTKVEMVQCANPDTDDGKVGEPNRQGGARPLSGFRARHPVAMLRERADGRIDLYQIAFFDVQHRVQQQEGATRILRHFFY